MNRQPTTLTKPVSPREEWPLPKSLRPLESALERSAAARLAYVGFLVVATYGIYRLVAWMVG